MKIDILLTRPSVRNLLLGGMVFCLGYAGMAQTPDSGILTDSLPNIEEVNVAYGKQSKISMTSATSSMSGEDLRKTLTPTLSNALYGRLPGLTVMQGSGEPGYDAPSMLIRGKSTYNDNGYLVMVDGFESSFDQLAVDEIESISVLKDAAALALYGIRGANGVILATTKRGEAGKTKIAFNAQTGWQQPIRLPEFLDAYNYASLYNEALANDGLAELYSAEEIEAYRSGNDPYLYPNVSWYDETLSKNAPISSYSLTFRGGDKSARYFILLGHMRNEGLYSNTDGERKINSNADFRRYNLRSNLDLQISRDVSASVDFGGRIEDRSFPNYNGPALWDNMAKYPANAYPVRNPDGSWGGSSVYPDNPVASILDRGFNSSHDRDLYVTMRLTEDIGFIVDGLKFTQAISANNWHRGNYNKTKTFSFTELVKGRTEDGRDTLIFVPRGTDADFSVSESGNDQNNRLNVQFALDYEKQYRNSRIAAMAMYHQDVYYVSGNNVPYAQQSVMGRLNYSHSSRYFAELGFSYSGSERFPKGKRFGFFPALSAAWVLSSEEFLKGSSVVSFLKARGSAGLVGNDRLPGNRFAYAQDYYYSGDYRYVLGKDNTSWDPIMEGSLANPNITWEKALMYNFGLEGRLFNHLSFGLDLFYETRNDVLASAAATTPAYIGVSSQFENVGKVNNRGFEIDLDYSNKVGEFTYFIGSSASFSRSKIIEMNEVIRPEEYLYRTGQAVGQPFGLEALGFYQQGDFDSDGNLKPGFPLSTFAPVQPGDIRYRDQNADGYIDENDEIAIGKALEPELTYAANLGAQFKGFDIELFFHGIAGRDVYLNGPYFWAFINDANIAANALNRWTVNNQENASYPRLTTLPNENNYRRSTFWNKPGNVLRLRNIEVGYSLPERLVEKVALSGARLFVNGVNLFTWDKIETVDPENWSGYPSLKSYSAGVRLQF